MKLPSLGVRLAIYAVLLSAAWAFYTFGRSVWVPIYIQIAGRSTVADVVEDLGVSARNRLEPFFEAAQVAYPPENVTLLVMKDSAELELWCEQDNGPVFIRTYAIQGLSGTSGPKLREGDCQVPEGVYRIEGLNPNSRYHLSMKLDYPNAFDRKYAEAEGRQSPGSNIFIHGKNVSIGCIAMGDTAIEELFILTADAGKACVTVVIAPTDPRKHPLKTEGNPEWVAALYRQIHQRFLNYTQLDP